MLYMDHPFPAAQPSVVVGDPTQFLTPSPVLSRMQGLASTVTVAFRKVTAPSRTGRTGNQVGGSSDSRTAERQTTTNLQFDFRSHWTLVETLGTVKPRRGLDSPSVEFGGLSTPAERHHQRCQCGLPAV